MAQVSFSGSVLSLLFESFDVRTCYLHLQISLALVISPSMCSFLLHPITYVKLCDLFVEWHDSYSSEYDCDWYSDDGNCQAYSHGQGLAADQFEYDGLTAGEACCSCGGGTTGGTSEGSGEELLVANKLADFKPSPHLQMTSSSFDAK